MTEPSPDRGPNRGTAVLARFAPAAASAPGAGETVADEEECPAFGYLRGLRDRALALEFRFANGDSAAYPYSWLGPIEYNPSAGLLLKFVGDLVYLVLLEGSNLNALVNDAISLYDRGLLRQRVTWVREMTREQLSRAGEGEVTVERIRTLSYRPDDEPLGINWLEPFRD
jgi:hypothetical protein